jgi:hypothetical protein
MLNPAFLNQLSYCSCHFLYRYIGIDTMLIKQIDGFNIQSLKRAFNHLFDVFRTTIKTGFFSVLNVEAELCGNDHFVSVWSECFAY